MPAAGSGPAAPSPYPVVVTVLPTEPGKHKVTVSDVVALSRADVDETVIINHIRSHGLAAPMRTADVVYLQQQGVSRKVIEAMQAPLVPLTEAPRYSPPATVSPKK